MFKLPLLFIFLSTAPLFAQVEEPAPKAEEFTTRMQEAQALVAKGSYRQALAIYDAYREATGLTPQEHDTLTFLRADATWRDLATTEQTDPQLIQAQRDVLIDLAERLKKDAPTPRPPELWAQVEESLGDSYRLTNTLRVQGEAWPHYQQALDWWAGSTDVATARGHYLDIIFRALLDQERLPGQRTSAIYSGWPVVIVPPAYLDKALTLTDDETDLLRLHLKLGQALQERGTGISYAAPSQRRQPDRAHAGTRAV